MPCGRYHINVWYPILFLVNFYTYPHPSYILRIVCTCQKYFIQTFKAKLSFVHENKNCMFDFDFDIFHAFAILSFSSHPIRRISHSTDHKSLSFRHHIFRSLISISKRIIYNQNESHFPKDK